MMLVPCPYVQGSSAAVPQTLHKNKFAGSGQRQMSSRHRLPTNNQQVVELSYPGRWQHYGGQRRGVRGKGGTCSTVGRCSAKPVNGTWGPACKEDKDKDSTCSRSCWCRHGVYVSCLTVLVEPSPLESRVILWEKGVFVSKKG